MNELLHKFKLGNDAELLLEKRGGGYEKVATVPIGSQALGVTQSAQGVVFQEDVPVPDAVTAALPAELAGLKMTRKHTFRRQWGEVNIGLDDLLPGWDAWPATYVDVTAAGNGTGTEASPFWTCHAAVTAANATGQPARIFIKGGTPIVRTKGISNSGSVIPVVPIVFIAYSGRAVVGAHENLTWAVDATITTGVVYKTARSNMSLLIDLLGRDENGYYPRFPVRASAADVGSFGGVYTDNTSIWVKRSDGAAVTDANTRCFLAVDNLRLNGTTQTSVAYIGATENDGFDFEGGSGGTLRVSYTGGGAGTRRVIYAKDCTFRYGGHSTGATGNVAIEGFNGTVLLDSCDLSNGATDGMNIHNALGATKTALLTLNCTGRNFGLTSGYVSNNFWTLHDSNVVGIDLCSDGGQARGVTAHIINTSIGYLAGTKLAGSLGDVMNGGGNAPCEIKAEDQAQLYLWQVQAAPSAAAGRFALRSEGTATIYVRECPDLAGKQYVGPSATLASW